jgi:hypothetical protein
MLKKTVRSVAHTMNSGDLSRPLLAEWVVVQQSLGVVVADNVVVVVVECD